MSGLPSQSCHILICGGRRSRICRRVQTSKSFPSRDAKSRLQADGSDRGAVDDASTATALARREAQAVLCRLSTLPLWPLCSAPLPDHLRFLRYLCSATILCSSPSAFTGHHYLLALLSVTLLLRQGFMRQRPGCCKSATTTPCKI